MIHEQSEEKASSSDSHVTDLSRNGHMNMRGSAASVLAAVGKTSSDATALTFAQSNDIATQIHHLEQAKLDMDTSLNELNLILTGDADVVRSASNMYGIQQQGVAQILEYINEDIGLAQGVDDLNAIIRNEIQPMLADVYSLLEETLPETERRLAGIFEHTSNFARETFAPSTSPSGDSSSQPPVRPEDYAKSSHPDGFEFVQGKSPNVENLLKEMLKDTHTAGFFDPTSRSPRGMGSFLNHHHRRRHGSVGRRNQHAKRRLEEIGSQDALQTCPASCADIEDDILRKECNCADLYKCANALKDTDMVVLMSRGVVDKDTGTIEVEKADLSNERLWAAGTNGESLVDDSGNLKQTTNAALDDIFDARQMLVKMNRIRGFVLHEKCEELLDEFHVPCRDWQDGCSGSDGRSYRLVSNMQLSTVSMGLPVSRVFDLHVFIFFLVRLVTFRNRRLTKYVTPLVAPNSLPSLPCPKRLMKNQLDKSLVMSTIICQLRKPCRMKQ